MSDNPLKRYFRTPSIHLELPSKGEYYKEGAIEMPVTGEVPVFPMSALDDIIYKTPDALFNGSAVVDVIKSCIPAIKDPWQMPVNDLTSVLTAIRIASLGHDMDIETQCPKCESVADYTIDLRNVLDSVVIADYTKPLVTGDLQIYFKPMVYKDLNESNMLRFEEDKMRQILVDSNIEQSEQIRLLSEAFKKVSDYTIKTIAKNIKSIVTPDISVDNEEHILEFLKSCENELYKRIKSAVVEHKSKEVLKPLHITCSECKHKYDQAFTMDMTSFFAQNS